ncbi:MULTISPECIES: DUF4198 domain-containing protein [unclassified Maridesulfovibrio]|uniref:DUF4198 domain-containing protein n=1 Tax=unclassified Maridesulfovibrio TaxID=2794999 RepID=UPI003B3CF582
MARKLWINMNESFGLHKSLETPPWHYFVSLGYGHVVPNDDFVDAALTLDSFELVSPSMKKTSLRPPEGKVESLDSAAGATVSVGDVAPRKIAFNGDAEKGVHQVVAATKEEFFALWEEDGKVQTANLPLNEVADKNVLTSVKYQAFAKTFLKNEEWKKPEALGHALEIIPLTDLSDVHVGDWVTFQVDFMGKPFTCTQESMEFLLASSNTFGGEGGGELEGFFLSAYIVNGRARIKMPTAGQWLINVFSRQDVTPDNELKVLSDSCRKVYFGSSITFNVKA